MHKPAQNNPAPFHSADSENEIDLSVEIAGVRWKNPITTASGTFTLNARACYDIGRLGAVTTKGIATVPWPGNKTPRIAETYGGMLNAVGLQNVGMEAWIRDELPALRSVPGLPIIANIVGKTVEEYAAVAARLSETDVDMIELNISCPNVKEGGIAFGTTVEGVYATTAAVRKAAKKPLIVKLSPNVTQICDMAKAAADAGADALSLINTLLGMKIDVYRRKVVLANKTGGLSGPGIHPIAVRMVYEVRRAVPLPIVGMGGVMSGEDAAELILAGADAVAVGTAALLTPDAPIRILGELRTVMRKIGAASVRELKNSLVEPAWKERLEK